MPETAADALTVAQRQLDPTGQGLFPDSYVLGYIDTAAKSLRNRILAREITLTEKLVNITAFPANTTDLSAYLLAGQPLADLVEVDAIREKQSGTDDNNYTEVARMEELPGRTPYDLLLEYEWRGGAVYFIGANQTLDLQIRYRATWPAITSTTQTLPAPGLAVILGLWGAALVLDSLGSDQRAQALLAEARHLQAGWTQQRILEAQLQTIRPKPFRRRPFEGPWGLNL